jgi:hypothetical protein
MRLPSGAERFAKTCAVFFKWCVLAALRGRIRCVKMHLKPLSLKLRDVTCIWAKHPKSLEDSDMHDTNHLSGAQSLRVNRVRSWTMARILGASGRAVAL